MLNKKVFLDCGANVGGGFNHFKNLYPLSEYEYWLFEPNPECYKVLLEELAHVPQVRMIWAALHTENTWATLNFRTVYDVGASIITAHNSAYDMPDHMHHVRVPVVNLDALVSQLYTQGYQIIIKLDVESSEYDILERMIQTGNLDKIHTLYCEFHSQYMNDADKAIYKQREHVILNHIHDSQMNFHHWI